MKKVFALFCAAALAASLVACGSESSSPAPTAEPTPSVTPEASEPTAMPETDETGDSTVAEPDSELSGLVDSIYAEYEVPIMTVVTAVDVNDSTWIKPYTGLDDGSQLDAAVVSESAIGSQAYNLVLVRVADGVDAAQVADQMAAGIDPRKWVCVTADDIIVGSAGNIAMLVMVDSQLDISAQSIADAFVKVEGDGASCWKPETVGSSEGGIPGDAPTEVTPVG